MMHHSNMIELYNEDCMIMMGRYPDKHFDLAIVDLEYGIGASKPTKKSTKVKQKNGTNLYVKDSNYVPKDWDFKMSSPDYFKELFRVTKNQIIFGGFYYGLAGGAIVWDKLNGESDQYGCEIAWQSFDKRTDIVYYMWSGMMQGEYCGKDLKKALRQQGNKKLNEPRIHPTQKPVILYKYFLTNYAKQGYKILDTHGGSFSHAIACFDYGFDLVISEIDKDIFQSGKNRFDAYSLQTDMFRK